MKFQILLILIIFSCSCKRTERLEFERFSFIGFTYRTISPDDTIPNLWIANYIEINNNDFNFSYINYPLKGKNYYQIHVSDKLINLINNNFTNTQIDTIGKPVAGLMYDGLMYCYCVKKKGQQEKFYYYNPYELPDNWNVVYKYLDSIIEYDITVKTTPPKDFQERINTISERFDWQNMRIWRKLTKPTIRFVPPVIKPDNEN